MFTKITLKRWKVICPFFLSHLESFWSVFEAERCNFRFTKTCCAASPSIFVWFEPSHPWNPSDLKHFLWKTSQNFWMYSVFRCPFEAFFGKESAFSSSKNPTVQRVHFLLDALNILTRNFSKVPQNLHKNFYENLSLETCTAYRCEFFRFVCFEPFPANPSNFRTECIKKSLKQFFWFSDILKQIWGIFF